MLMTNITALQTNGTCVYHTWFIREGLTDKDEAIA